MKNKTVAILSAGVRGKKLVERLKNSMKIRCIVDNDHFKWDTGNGIETPVVSFYDASKLYELNEIDYFILPAGLNIYMQQAMVEQLLTLGVSVERIMVDVLNEFNKEELIKFDEAYFLPYLEIPIVEHCNLNCKGCSHFSPIAKPKEYELDRFKKDIRKLKEKIVSISVIRLLGGEPLLCNQLIGFVEETRKVYPESEIRIVTNALLLNSMEENFWDLVKQNNVIIDITLYPILYPKEKQIINCLNEHNVAFIMHKTSVFRKTLSDRKSKVFGNLSKDWERCQCTNLYDGKVSPCAIVMFINILNAKFGCNYPDNGIIDLYDNRLGGKQLIEELGKSIPLCDYCTLVTRKYPRTTFEYDDAIAWERINNTDAIKDDWIIRQKDEQNNI